MIGLSQSCASLQGGVHDRLHCYPFIGCSLITLAYTPARRGQRIILSPSKDTGNAG